jgi:hypothetical protein
MMKKENGKKLNEHDDENIYTIFFKIEAYIIIFKSK